MKQQRRYQGFLEVLCKPVYGISAGSLQIRVDGPYSSPKFVENLKKIASDLLHT